LAVIWRGRREYERLWERENRLLPVILTSAVELDERTTADLASRIGERTGRTVDLQTRVEPDILGGIVVQIGNSILDASIRNRLEQLRRQVAAGAA
jgi:F-type H+-transporting ATPase subunit delta